MSRQSICYNIYREVMRYAKDMLGTIVSLRINPEIADLLHGEENHIILSLEERIGKQIIIYPDRQFHLEDFEIVEIYKT